MTVRQIRKAVKEIKALTNDSEGQHGREDALHQEVLQAIADGAENPAVLAKEALKTRKLKFSRWTA